MAKVWLIADYKQAEAMVVAWAGPVPLMKHWFQTKQDIHLNVAKMIGEIVHKHNITMPTIIYKDKLYKLWNEKPWPELNKYDPERQTAKNTVHGNNYDVGVAKFAAMTGLPYHAAKILMEIYHTNIFPEIRLNYHTFIQEQLKISRTVVNPQGWKRTFFDILGPEVYRAAYAWYAQSAIGLKTIRAIRRLCEIHDQFFDEVTMLTPTTLRASGLDIQFQCHDSIGVSTEDDPKVMYTTARTMKEIMEEPLIIRGEPCIIPVDFKYGYNWGDLKDYELPEAA